MPQISGKSQIDIRVGDGDFCLCAPMQYLVADLEAAGTGPAARVLLAQQRQVVAVEGAALRVTEDLQVRHPLEAHAVQVLRT